jgi:hypothetical protein
MYESKRSTRVENECLIDPEFLTVLSNHRVYSVNSRALILMGTSSFLLKGGTEPIELKIP